jgi:glycerate 2-kinase
MNDTTKLAELKPAELLLNLFYTAVSAASPHKVLPGFLPADTNRKAIVIGAGKAAASMAQSIEQHWQGELSGLVVTRYGHDLPCKKIEVVQASHPVPDNIGADCAQRIFDLVSKLSKDDLVICLISGGGSSLLALPADGISLTDKQCINQALLRSGAAIDDMNCVRKHLSAIKGGKLAAASYPAKVITYAISDVPGDKATVIASGPTVADPTTSADALATLTRYNIDIPSNVLTWLSSSDSETIKPGDKILAGCEYHLIATPAAALNAAIGRAEQSGLKVLSLGDQIEGEASAVAKEHAALTLSIINGEHQVKPPCIILSGGETTVTLSGNGRGGRNAEYLLSLANCLQGTPNVYALAADTDGIDGSEDNAGALLSPTTWQRAADLNIDPAAMLANNDGYSFFEQLGDLIITGPTRTNVNDFRAIYITTESLENSSLGKNSTV